MNRFTVEAELAAKMGTRMFTDCVMRILPTDAARISLDHLIIEEQKALLEMNATGVNDHTYEELHIIKEGLRVLLNSPGRYERRVGETITAQIHSRVSGWINEDDSLGPRGRVVVPRLAIYAVQANAAQRLQFGGYINKHELDVLNTFLAGCMENDIICMEKNAEAHIQPLEAYYEEFVRTPHIGCVTRSPYGYDCYDQPRLMPLFSQNEDDY